VRCAHRRALIGALALVFVALALVFAAASALAPDRGARDADPDVRAGRDAGASRSPSASVVRRERAGAALPAAPHERERAGRGAPLATAPDDAGALVASATRETARDRRETRGFALQLFDVFERPDDPVVGIAGFDARAPRSLVLFQIDEASRSAEPVARVESGEDGVFAIERLLLSARGVRLVVAPAGSDPFGPDASTPVDFAAQAPEAPRAWLEPGEAGAPDELVVATHGAPIALVLADDAQRPLARVELPGEPRRAGATARVSLAGLSPGSRAPAWIAREAQAGSRSAWQPLRKSAPEEAHALEERP